MIADEGRGQGRRHLGHRQRPHHQDLGAAITEQPSADPRRQALAADGAHQHQRGELKVAQAFAKAAQIQQQSQIDEEDRDEQHATHKDHLLLHPALGQHGIHRQTSQEGADDLLNAGQLSPQGGQEQGHQNSEHHPVFIADAAQHQAPAQPADADHHHQSEATDLEQQQAQAQAAEAALAQPQPHRQQQQGHDVGEDRAAHAHHHRLILLGAITAHDRVTQGGVGGHQGAEQQARHRGEARHQADRHARAHTDQQDQQAIDERAAFDPVELLEVDLQTHGEQQIHRPEIGKQPHRFAAAVDPVQGMGAHHHTRRQQPHQVGQTQPPDQRRHRRTDRHQHREHPEGVMHDVADRGLHGHGCTAGLRTQHGRGICRQQQLLQEAISPSPAWTCQRLV